MLGIFKAILSLFILNKSFPLLIFLLHCWFSYGGSEVLLVLNLNLICHHRGGSLSLKKICRVAWLLCARLWMHFLYLVLSILSTCSFLPSCSPTAPGPQSQLSLQHCCPFPRAVHLSKSKQAVLAEASQAFAACLSRCNCLSSWEQGHILNARSLQSKPWLLQRVLCAVPGCLFLPVLHITALTSCWVPAEPLNLCAPSLPFSIPGLS